MNSVAESLTGWKENEVKGKSLSEVFNVINEETNKPIGKILLSCVKGWCSCWSHKSHDVDFKKGNKIPIADSGSPIKNSDGRKLLVLYLFFVIKLKNEKKKKYLLKVKKDLGKPLLPALIL